MAKKDIRHEVEKNYQEFAEAVSGLVIPELEQRLLGYAKEREKVREAKEADERLQSVLELKSELEGPYKDINKAINLKSRYLILLIKDKGGDV